MSACLGFASWYWVADLQLIRSFSAKAVHHSVAVATGIVTSFVILRYLMPSLHILCSRSRRGVDRIAAGLCVTFLAMFSALFGFCDFNLVTMYGDLTPKDSLRLASWVRPQHVALTVTTCVLWISLGISYSFLCYKILRYVKSHLSDVTMYMLTLSSVGQLVGIYGYCGARIAGPMITGLWDGKYSSGNRMLQALEGLDTCVQLSGSALTISGVVIVWVGMRLPREQLAGACRSCGYPASGIRCPECGSLHNP